MQSKEEEEGKSRDLSHCQLLGLVRLHDLVVLCLDLPLRRARERERVMLLEPLELLLVLLLEVRLGSSPSLLEEYNEEADGGEDGEDDES